MNVGERRKLVFSNLANGLAVADVMQALRMSEKEVLDDFKFVCLKIRSYRFERAMPVIALDTIQNARINRVDALYTLSRLNPSKDPSFSKIEELPFDDGPGRVSSASAKLQEMRFRGQANGR